MGEHERGVSREHIGSRFIHGWAARTPWWWMYAPLGVVCAVFFVLYLGGWVSEDLNYGVVRALSFVAVGLYALDQSRHKTFYNRRRYRRRSAGIGRARRFVGWSLIVVAAVLSLFGAVVLLASDMEGAESFALFAVIALVVAVYLLRSKPRLA